MDTKQLQLSVTLFVTDNRLKAYFRFLKYRINEQKDFRKSLLIQLFFSSILIPSQLEMFLKIITYSNIKQKCIISNFILKKTKMISLIATSW